jgi:lipoprotein-anchoring transpeptidase ErfK/SrfK
MFSKFLVRSALLIGGSLFCLPTLALPAPLATPPGTAAQTPDLPPLESSGDQPLLSESQTEDQTVRLVLRLGERQVYVYQGKAAIAIYPVAIGRPDTPTPTGEFQVFEMIEDPAWKNPRTGEVEAPGADGSLGTRWIGFVEMPNGVIGFHGTPNRSSIGRAASHGCVRMRNEDVVAMFEHVIVGTVVTVEP